MRHHKPAKPATKGPIVFFQGCAGGYFETETSKKSIEVLEHLGYEVLVPKQGCCGLAKQSNGLFEGATKDILSLCDKIISLGKGLTVVSSSGSCVGMMKHEAHEIMGVDDPRLHDVSVRSLDFSEFLMDEYRNGELDTSQFRPIDITVPYHQPCQVKSQGMGFPAVQLMELIPGVKVLESNEPCCGIAGTYGLKAERYKVAQKIGAGVFKHMQDHNEGVGVCDTETCRWQISKSSGVKIVHPVWLLHHSLGLSNNLLD
jgi:glycerol-3-phosphate dehydrogenase subunit C